MRMSSMLVKQSGVLASTNKVSKSLSLEIGHHFLSYLLFEFKNELSRSSPAALSLVHTLVVQQHPLQGLGGGGLLGAGVLGHFLHQDVVTRVGIGEDAVGILGL